MIVFNTLKEIGQKFRLPGEIYSYDAITMGNINSTYKVTYTQNDNSLKSYLVLPDNLVEKYCKPL